MKRLVALGLGSALGCAVAFGCGEERSQLAPQRVADADAVPDGTTDATGPDAVASQGDSSVEGDGGAPATLRVLFIGNSYTYVNDVPGILARIAATAGSGPAIVTDEVVQGRATLADHLEAGVAGARIAERRFTHVVLQEQSLLPALVDLEFLSAAKQLGDRIADAGARATWFVTWARAAGDVGSYPSTFHDPAEMQDRLTMAYDDARRQSPGSQLSCVGEAFRASLRDHPEILLHQADNSHATVAGAYLAASTFYVALTGRPVPPTAEVPTGVGEPEASLLRKAANVGTECAEVRTRGIISVTDMTGTGDGLLSDGGAFNSYDYAVAAVRIPARFRVGNTGALPATIAGPTLSGPFEWTDGAFPGGSGTSGGGLSFCSSSLAPKSECVVSVSFTGKTSGTGQLALPLANAYRTKATRTMSAISGSKDRALLTLSATTVPGEVILEGSFANLHFAPGHVANLVVTNRGGAPTTVIAEGQPLASPFIWGTPAAQGFPGGSGAGSAFSDPSVVLPYCGQVLAPGGQCLLGLGYSTASAQFFSGALSLAYADAKGAAPTNAAITVQVFPPGPTDAGTE